MVESRSPRLAVLIDADNAPPRIATGLFREIAKLGEAGVRRIYGDFSGPRLQQWSGLLSTHAIVPQQNFAGAPGKNASDIALVIDAMDLLHGGRFDGFCLVSSDSDFTRLAVRIRQEDVKVFGFGAAQTPESFRRACHLFVDFESLSPLAEKPRKNASAPAADRAGAAAPSGAAAKAARLIREAVARCAGADEDGWVRLNEVGSRLREAFPDFAARDYGSAKLSGLVRITGAFEIRPADGGFAIRPRPQGAKSSR